MIGEESIRTAGADPFARVAQDLRLIAEADGRIAWVSDSWTTVMGWEPDELVGGKLDQILHPEDLARAHAQRAKAVEGQEVRNFEARYRAKTGDYRWLRWSGWGDPTSGRIYAAGIDVSEYHLMAQAARDRAEELERIFEATPVPLLLATDPAASQIVGNAAAYELLEIEPGRNVSKSAPLGQMPTNYTPVRNGAPIPSDQLPMQRSAQKGEVIQDEPIDLVFEDGRVKRLLMSCVPLLSADGTPRGTASGLIEVTSLMEAQQKAEKSQAFLRLVADALPAALVYVDQEERYQFVNEKTRQWFRRDPAAEGLTMRELLGEEVYAHRKDAIRRALRGEAIRLEGPTRTADGRTMATEVTYVPDVAANGEVRGFVGMIGDVSEREETRRALERSEASLRRFIRTANEGILRIGPDDHVLFANEYFCRLLGYGPSEVIGMHVLDFVFAEDRNVGADRRRQRREQGAGERYEMRLRRKDGSELWVLNSTVVVQEDDEYDGTYTMITDITELKAVEGALRDSERRYRELADAMPQTIWTADAQGQADYYNQRWYVLRGRQNEATGDESWMPIVHPDDLARTAETWKQAVKSGEPYEIEQRLFDAPTNAYRWHLTRALPSRDESGQVTRWYGTDTDIHAQKSHEQILDFLVRLGEAVGPLSDEGHALGVVARMLAQQLRCDRVIFAQFEPDDTVAIVACHAESLPPLEGTREISPYARDLRAQLMQGVSVAIDNVPDFLPDGAREYYEPLQVRAHLAVPINRAENSVGSLAVHHSEPRAWTEEEIQLVQIVAERTRDLLERIRAHRRLRELNEELEARVVQRTQQLEAANREMEGFTYSVSHDLRAPLRAIVATSRLLQEEYGPELPEDARGLLTRQASNANRLATLIDELLQLSRLSRGEMRREEIDLSTMADEVVAELRRDREVQAHVRVEPGLRANGDPRLVRLVVLNLLDNALKFSPAGGMVTVGRSKAGFFVRDQGIGFDPQYEPKLWLPFERLVLPEEFPGTGIGLANVRRIAERHGGRTWAHGEPGKGATFWFTLE